MSASGLPKRRLAAAIATGGAILLAVLFHVTWTYSREFSFRAPQREKTTGEKLSFVGLQADERIIVKSRRHFRERVYQIAGTAKDGFRAWELETPSWSDAEPQKFDLICYGSPSREDLIGLQLAFDYCRQNQTEPASSSSSTFYTIEYEKGGRKIGGEKFVGPGFLDDVTGFNVDPPSLLEPETRFEKLAALYGVPVEKVKAMVTLEMLERRYLPERTR